MILSFLCLVALLCALKIIQTPTVHAKKEELTKVERDLRFQEAFEKSRLVPDVIEAIPWDEMEINTFATHRAWNYPIYGLNNVEVKIVFTGKFQQLKKRDGKIEKFVKKPNDGCYVCVDYNNGSVKRGNTLMVHQVWRKPPHLHWPKEIGTFYTLLFLAPDHPDPSKPRFREYVLWFIVNIYGRNIKEGDIIAEYIMPPPPEKRGRQRYLFLILEQQGTGKQKIEEEYIPPIPEDQARANFSTRRFIAKYNLAETPSAGNFFYIDWGIHT